MPKYILKFILVFICSKFLPAATDISRPQRSAESTAAPTTQSTISGPSPYSGTPFLVLQQGKDGRDGRDGLPGRTGEKGEPGVRGREGSTGPRGMSELLCRKARIDMFVTHFGGKIFFILDNQVSLVPVWVVWCTPGGGGPNVQTSLEQNLCMLEELLEVITPTRGEELTTYVYLTIRAIYSTNRDLDRTI